MPSKFKAIIVDDERLARQDLKAIIDEFDEIECVGEAKNIAGAKELLKKNNPNLLFLDIKMPGESGFDLLEFVEDETHIIFVTAFDEYAIKAFEVNALDYLLKPVSKERLALSIERLQLAAESKPNELKKLEIDDQIFVKLNSKYTFLKINTIVKISSKGDYSEIIISNGKKALVLKSMKEWESRLPENHFIRIHRSTIINTDQVNRIEPWYNNSHLVYLEGIEKPAVMSRRYFTKVKEQLK
ncbi:MAG: LytTR family DNA-binding domain-containing protein [Ignavibacteriaceae bacterium]|jgi:two-component system LytT family response regulator